MIQRLTGLALTMVLLGGLATGCGRPRSLQSSSPGGSGADNPHVLAADGVLCDLTRTLATPSITVHCLLSGGEDPHSFSLSPEQRGRLEQADLVLINGHGLTPVLATLVEQGKALAVAEAIELPSLEEADPFPMADDHDDHDHGDHHELSHDGEHHDDHGHEDHHALSHGDSPDPHHDDHHGHDHGGVDPHVWHDPENTQAMAMVVTRELTKLAPEDATALQMLNQEAVAVLKDMDAWAEQQVETIPSQQRVLATGHKAFGYYAQRYGFRELALQGFSTTEAVRPAVLSNLRRELAEASVVVLFPEQDPPGRSLQVIAQQTGIPLSPQHLIADGLAAGQSTVETFVGNTCAITNGLQGQCDEAGGEELASRWRILADHAHSTAAAAAS
ncbi:MAG: zinc ABC transporter substrate-binding protein [Synechococcus sp. SB0667_bin_8]|nr:zinc ABC transporter substrate-binding protein [Synechococcus sp. SB0667_bin_8]